MDPVARFVSVAGLILSVISLGWNIWRELLERPQLIVRADYEPVYSPISFVGETERKGPLGYRPEVTIVSKGKRPITLAKVTCQVLGQDNHLELESLATELNQSQRHTVIPDSDQLGDPGKVEFICVYDTFGKLYRSKKFPLRHKKPSDPLT